MASIFNMSGVLGVAYNPNHCSYNSKRNCKHDRMSSSSSFLYVVDTWLEKYKSIDWKNTKANMQHYDAMKIFKHATILKLALTFKYQNSPPTLLVQTSLIFVLIKEVHFCLDLSFSKLVQETLLWKLFTWSQMEIFDRLRSKQKLRPFKNFI